MSQWSKSYTERIWRKYMSNELLENCLKKLEVLQPPQAVLVDKEHISGKYDRISEFQFVFIGNDFWRKGGHDLGGTSFISM